MKFASTGFIFSIVCVLFLAGFPLTALASPLIVAHRGYSSIYPENTVLAIEGAASYAWGCEIDIRRTVDGQYILMHDATVDNTTNGTGAVSDLTFDYIRSLDAGSWKADAYAGTQVPTVLEAINAAMANNLKLCVEIKSDSVVASELVSILSPYTDYIEVHSFDEALLQEMANLGGDFTYVWIGSDSLTTAISNLSVYPCIDKFSWASSGITQLHIDTLHSLDKEIYAWTVNNITTALNMTNMGVDTILSDYPRLIDYTINGTEPEPGPYPNQLQDKLLGYWKFDEGLTDPLTRTAVNSADPGTNDATFTSTLSVPGAWKTGSEAKVGGAIELDGTNDTSESLVGSDLTAPHRAVTIATWLKLDELPSEMSASYGSIYDSTNDAYVLYLDKGNQKLRMKVTASAAAYPSIPQSMLDTTNWHYVVGVYDSGVGTAQIYLDGQLVDIVGNNGSPLYGVLAEQLATIGSTRNSEITNSNYFDGKIDELAVWGRPLGQAEIDYLYNQGQGQAIPSDNLYVGAPDPVVQYRFEGNLTNSGSGESAYNASFVDGIYGSTSYPTDGIEGNQALQATNQKRYSGGDYVNTGYTLTDTGTISFWCKPNEFYDTNTIFDSSSNADDWEMWVSSTGEATFRIENTSTVSCQLGDASSWYHFTVMWTRNLSSQTLLRLFVNGEMVDYTLDSSWIDPSGILYLFGGNSGNMFGNATLDDFRVYDTLLTSDEIMAIYLQQETPLIPGDANRDGYVDGSDATILAGYWQQENATWDMGDFNGDGVVDGSDATILAGYWQQGTPPVAAAVPEPSVATLLIFVTLLGWFLRKSRAN